VIVTVKGSADRDKAPFQQSQKQGDGASGKGQPQHCRRHPVQAAPPLSLTITRLITLPAPDCDPVLYATLDLSNSRTKAVPVALGFQTVDRLAAGTPQTAQENSFGKGGEISENETVPPERLMAARATGGFYPRKISAETGNLIDVGSNKKYQ